MQNLYRGDIVPELVQEHGEGLYTNDNEKQWEAWVEVDDELIQVGFCCHSVGKDGFQDFEYDYRDFWITKMVDREVIKKSQYTLH